jgi:hypothetical protein
LSLALRTGAERLAAEPEAADEIVARCGSMPLPLPLPLPLALALPLAAWRPPPSLGRTVLTGQGFP